MLISILLSSIVASALPQPKAQTVKTYDLKSPEGQAIHRQIMLQMAQQQMLQQQQQRFMQFKKQTDAKTAQSNN